MELPIYLTLDEAEKILPDVKKKMRKIMHINKSIDLIESIDIDSEKELPEVDVALLDINKNYFKKMYFFYKELLDLSKTGAVIKDIDEGLIDFYSNFENRDILLCWKYGENGITHWHEIDSGYDNRKPIELLKKTFKNSKKLNN